MTHGVYVARLDLDAPHLLGVAGKIAAQRAALHHAGFENKLYSLRSGAIMFDNEVLRCAAVKPLARRMTHYRHFWTDSSYAIDNAAFLYIRFQGVGPGFLQMLKRFRVRNHAAPILLEIPTYPYHGIRFGVRRNVLGLIDDLYAPRLKGNVDRIVTFSDHEEILGVPTLRTQNGVDVNALPFLPAPQSDRPIRLVGVANFSLWHGYDRVIEGLAHMPPETRKSVAIDFVGSGNETEALKDLAKARGVTDAVHFHGPLTGRRLEMVIASAHLGIGCLGLHRIYKERSDLKSREYCARGRPFLADRLERDFSAVAEFVHVCPQDDTPIDLNGLLSWYAGINKARAGAALRAHAEKYLSWNTKMKPVVDWLNSKVAG